jgi:hypothetical protein
MSFQNSRLGEAVWSGLDRPFDCHPGLGAPPRSAKLSRAALAVRNSSLGVNWSSMEFNGVVHTMWRHCGTQISAGGPGEQHKRP